MAKHVLLNNVEHKDLKVIARYAEIYGDNVSNVLTFVGEFSFVQKEYPIFFHRDPHTQALRPIVMLGFEEGENLFLDERNLHSNGWSARYVPAVVARGPFLIGFQNQEHDGGEERAPVIHVDLDSQRLSETDGEPIFLPFGGNSDYLDGVIERLQIIHQGLAFNNAMISVLTAHDLIEPVNLDIQFHNRHEYHIQGYYTISKEKLYGLDAAILKKLQMAGFLDAAYAMISSLTNIPYLIDLKNRKISASRRE